MEVHVKRKSKRRRRKNKILWVLMICMGISAITLCATKFIGIRKDRTTPEEVLLKYMGYIQEQNYTAMYQLIDVEASGQISEEDFVKRNSAIYEGIEVQNMAVTILSCDMEKNVVRYQTEFDTVAGEISFENEAYFLKTEDTYKLAWMDALIYPELLETDKVRVSVTQAKRGEILDRNGRVLAEKGTASSVGIVPGKLENQDDSLKQIADLLGMKPEEIISKMGKGRFLCPGQKVAESGRNRIDVIRAG
jgi:penicillin-binding protein